MTKLENSKIIKFYINSEETKPTSSEIPEGKFAELFEVDTGNRYIFNNSDWEVVSTPSSGGDSNFSTATMTVNTSSYLTYYGPICADEDDFFGMWSSYASIPSGNYTVPLYKGKLYVEIDTDSIFVDGNAEAWEDGYLVTGDFEVLEK